MDGRVILFVCLCGAEWFTLLLMQEIRLPWYLILSLENQNEIISVLSTSKILCMRLWVYVSFPAVTGPAFSLRIKGAES